MIETAWAAALDDFQFRCPKCQSTHLKDDGAQITCSSCKSTVPVVGGVARFQNLADTPALQDFANGYRHIRDAEGYTRRGAAFYRALPDFPPDDPDSWIWFVRRRSHRAFETYLRDHVPAAARVLDLGSGNGWLSHHMKVHGYRPVSVDINDDPDDGLAAHTHYGVKWPAVLSSFDQLPFADASFDVAVFNGSLHYSENLSHTLHEARRVVRPGGKIIIFDTPIYRDASSGVTMVRDRNDAHQARHGYQTPIEVSGFLTWDRIADLSSQGEMTLEVIKPWYGVKWAVRPFIARLRGTREPATFALVAMTIPANA